MIYYRMALRGSQTASWRWKSSPFTSLNGVLGMLKLYGCVPREHMRIFLSTSSEQMEAMLRQKIRDCFPPPLPSINSGINIAQLDRGEAARNGTRRRRRS